MPIQRTLDQMLQPSEQKSAASPVESCPKKALSLQLSSEDLPYSELAKTFEQVEATTKRLEINDFVSSLYLRVMQNHPKSLLHVVYLSANRIAPDYEGLELGLGESLLMKAIAEATGRGLDKVRAEVERKGDLGLVAQECKSTQRTLFKPRPLTISHVYSTLREIATLAGKESAQRKVDKVKGLLVACQGSEAKYLVRSLEGKLRIGLAESSILISLAQAANAFQGVSQGNAPALDNTAAVAMLKSVFHEIPSFDVVVPALQQHGLSQLPLVCHMTPGIPLKPMLAHPTRSISEVLNRFEGITFTCEFKYDGERAQIHRLPNGAVKIFSRNAEDMTEKYPDIVQNMQKIVAPHVGSFVLDCEAVAWDSEKNQILPFQVLTTRKRKTVKVEEVVVRVCLFAFDMLYLNGGSLLQSPLRKRRELLRSSFTTCDGEFYFAKSVDATSTEEIAAFLEDAIAGRCEGLMVKTLDSDSSYEPSKRCHKWLKVKKDYLDGVCGDSLDLLVIGGYFGRGKRTGAYGGYLLACYDPDAEQYQAVCKIGTGFSEADLEAQFRFFSKHISSQPKPYYNVTDAIKPDVWFEPTQVWEVRFADLSLSPIYTAAVGEVDPTKGISLRFPRFIRVREDKSPESVTTSQQIAGYFCSQSTSVEQIKDSLEY